MKKCLSLALFFALVLSLCCVTLGQTSSPEGEKPSFTITCVGDSITEGCRTSGGYKGPTAFPALLEGLLNDTGIADYTVYNCGKSATTALKKGDLPYTSCVEYHTSLNTDPDVVIICLGANDSKKHNWNAAQYEVDYLYLIKEYMELESKPTVYLFYTTYVADQSKTGCTRTVIQDEILPIQYSIAENLGLKIIDLNTLTKENATKYADGVHPNDELHVLMAEYIFNALCSEEVCGLTVENATEEVAMIDPSEAEDSSDTDVNSSSSSSSSKNSDTNVVSESSEKASDKTSDTSDSGNSNGNGWIIWGIISVVAIVVLAGGIVCVVLALKKKK